mmetsp:Transcript_132976/g.284231  ORF Transcript_132976/g.284231 Transcript_132976/m.284231 type:complete len:80 (+) Transcript_132976:764-1003(+)
MLGNVQALDGALGRRNLLVGTEVAATCNLRNKVLKFWRCMSDSDIKLLQRPIPARLVRCTRWFQNPKTLIMWPPRLSRR